MNKKIIHFSYIFYITYKTYFIELVKKGLAKVVIMEKRRPLIYQDQLLNAQEEAKKNKIGIWE